MTSKITTSFRMGDKAYTIVPVDQDRLSFHQLKIDVPTLCRALVGGALRFITDSDYLVSEIRYDSANGSEVVGRAITITGDLEHHCTYTPLKRLINLQEAQNYVSGKDDLFRDLLRTYDGANTPTSESYTYLPAGTVQCFLLSHQMHQPQQPNSQRTFEFGRVPEIKGVTTTVERQAYETLFNAVYGTTDICVNSEGYIATGVENPTKTRVAEAGQKFKQFLEYVKANGQAIYQEVACETAPYLVKGLNQGLEGHWQAEEFIKDFVKRHPWKR